MLNLLTKNSPIVVDIITKLSNTCYIITEEMESKKRYNKFIDEIYEYLKSGFEIKELRECGVYFKFNSNEESKLHKMQLRHFLTNIMMWIPFMRLGVYDDLDDTKIVDCRMLTGRYIKSYLDNNVIKPYSSLVSNQDMNIILHDTLFALKGISTNFSLILGISMSLKPFIDVADRNPRFNEIIRTNIDESKQPAEVEDMLDDLLNEELDILRIEDTILRPILCSGSGIKEKQLQEATISGGYKPDISGNTIPKPINSNLLFGFQNISNYFIDSKGGRKSIIMEKGKTGDSGYFSRRLILLSSNKTLSPIDDCGSIHPLLISIDTSNHFRRFIGRVYKLPNEREYKILKETDTHVIGKKILVRSPMTCACEDGNICRTCYGPSLSHTNEGINIGTYAGIRLTGPLTQMILSTKHLLTTVSVPIEFVEDFKKFFKLQSNRISIKSKIKEMNKYSLVIYHDDINIISELNVGDVSEFTNIIYIRNDETGEEVAIHENSLACMYLSTYMHNLLDIGENMSEEYSVKLSHISKDNKLFFVEIENNELTKPLYSIQSLLNNAKFRERGNIDTLDKLAQTMLELLIKSGINSPYVHTEVVMSGLVRSRADILKTPNFMKYDALNDVNILTIDKALMTHPSLSVSFSHEMLDSQMTTPLSYRKKTESFMDDYYRLNN